MARLNWSGNAARGAMSRYGSEQAFPRNRALSDNWGGGGKRSKPSSPREVRSWWLTCEHCGHSGTLEISLIDLRAAVVAGRVRCQECGVIREPNT